MTGFLRGLVSNPHYKFVSLLGALMLWLYVQGEQTVDAVVRGEVVWRLPPGLVAAEPLPNTVSMVVTGPRAAVRRAGTRAPSVIIDLSELETGAHLIELSAYPVEDLEGLTLNRLSPSSVGFSLDELSSRKVVVDTVLVGTPREGYRVRSALPDPLVVTVRGARAAIQDRVEVPTRPIDISGLAEDQSFLAEIDLPSGVERVGDEVIEVFIDLEAESDSRRYADVPVSMWPPSEAAAWTLSPSTVTVELEGAASALRAIDTEDLVVFAHLPDDATRGSYTARQDAGAGGARLRVLHGGGELVSVVAVNPTQVEVRRR